MIYVRLFTNSGDQLELEKFQKHEVVSDHLEAFATKSLRTLCLAYWFVSSQEYKRWNKRYQEASTTIDNCEEKIEEACEEIEKDMMLMTSTAVEDNLQAGVPGTIAELAQSAMYQLLGIDGW